MRFYPINSRRLGPIRRSYHPHRESDRGVIITLVAVFMLFVIGAMAALSIDVVTLYTARSEAQMAADAGALAGARVLANSGATSDPGRRSIRIRNAMTLATEISTQVASQNVVGGRTLNPVTSSGEVTISFPNGGDPAFDTNPHVKVAIQRTDLPTFFARIWGSTRITVGASATAEAYNPSGADALGQSTVPIAPICVKPWLFPNSDPTQAGSGGGEGGEGGGGEGGGGGGGGGGGRAIFDSTTGAIISTGRNSLVGQGWGPNTGGGNPNGLSSGDLAPSTGQYYPGAIDANDFPAPTQALPSCSTGFTAYQLAVAGCVQRPISCGSTPTVKVDINPYFGRDAETVAAANCLTHFSGAQGDSDSIDPANSQPPFQFIAGNQNPVASAVGKNALVSDSLVTVPVIDVTNPPTARNPDATVIGFMQLFLNPAADPIRNNQIPVTIINLAGCGTNATGQPILGNGASPVAVRLISQ